MKFLHSTSNEPQSDPDEIGLVEVTSHHLFRNDSQELQVSTDDSENPPQTRPCFPRMTRRIRAGLILVFSE